MHLISQLLQFIHLGQVNPNPMKLVGLALTISGNRAGSVIRLNRVGIGYIVRSTEIWSPRLGDHEQPVKFICHPLLSLVFLTPSRPFPRDRIPLRDLLGLLLSFIGPLPCCRIIFRGRICRNQPFPVSTSHKCEPERRLRTRFLLPLVTMPKCLEYMFTMHVSRIFKYDSRGTVFTWNK